MKLMQDEAIKLQCDAAGMVWLADGMSVPSQCTDNFYNIFEALPEREQYRFRLLGLKENADLIVWLFNAAVSRDDITIELATPRLCQAAERQCPEVAIFRMRQCTWPSSLGGWHAVTLAEYFAYCLAAELQRSDVYTATVDVLFKQHPAYHDLAFIDTLYAPAAARVVAEILDPRWFINLAHPYRVSALKNFMGISPQYCGKANANTVKGRRFQLVKQAWKGGGIAPQGTDRPGDFLWRRQVNAKSKRAAELQGAGDFIAYLSRTWHTQLLVNSPQKVELFIPDQLFKPAELLGYQEHSLLRGTL